MHRLGGKVIPNSNPPVRFKLNHNSTRLQPGEPDTSIWVGDLSPDVDDYALYQFFSQRYQTVRCAKVLIILSCPKVRKLIANISRLSLTSLDSPKGTDSFDLATNRNNSMPWPT